MVLKLLHRDSGIVGAVHPVNLEEVVHGAWAELLQVLQGITKLWVWAGLIHIDIWLFRADGQIICGLLYCWIEMIIRMESLQCELGDVLLLGDDFTTTLNNDDITATEILLFSVYFEKIQILINKRFRILSLIKFICNWINGDASDIT